MPVSTSIHISFVIPYICGFDPKSVLDIGCGFGTWGYLCRNYLDVFNGRVQPEDWQVRIDGVEYWEPYIQAHQRHLYDNILIGDIRDLVHAIDEYDLIIAGDVIEHLDKDDAERVVEALYAKARKGLIVNIPIGAEGWDHPENHGNPAELHRSAWTRDDFAPYPNQYQQFQLPNAPYGVFICPKDVTPEARVAGMVYAAERALDDARPARAIHLLRTARRLAPNDPGVALMLAEAAAQTDEWALAAEALEGALGDDPERQRNYLLLMKVQLRLGQRDDARATLARLLALPAPDPTLAEEAERLLQG